MGVFTGTLRTNVVLSYNLNETYRGLDWRGFVVSVFRLTDEP